MLDSMSKQEKFKENDEKYIFPDHLTMLRPLKMPSIKDTMQGTASIVNVSLPSEKLLAWNRTNPGISSILTRKKEGEMEPEADEKIKFTKEEIKELKEEVKFLDEENYRGGVLNALKNIREKGYLLEQDYEIAGKIIYLRSY
jgi:hypothetical protein